MMKRKLSIIMTVLMVAMAVLSSFSFAASADDTFVAMGADLTADQRATVLNLLGMTEEDLADIHLVQITNAMEHEKLGGYLPSNVIGSRALSCVKVEKTRSGGINVTTKNISYCTEGMYKNALATAGIENADVMVAAPMNISGTAGLVGAMEAYKQLTGKKLDEDKVDAAVDELVTTGELSDSLGNSEDAENLVALVKEEVASNNLKTDEEILQAIDDAAAQLGITLSDNEKQLILKLMKKLSTLDLDPEKLKKQASDIYERLKGMGIDFSQYDKESIVQSLTGWLSRLAEMCRSIFNR